MAIDILGLVKAKLHGIDGWQSTGTGDNSYHSLLTAGALDILE